MSGQLCFKCHVSEPAIISREGKKKLYCVECFKKFSFNVFRTSVQRATLTDTVEAKEGGIIAVSGGRSSMLLLDWLCELREYQEKTTHTPWEDLIVVFVKGLDYETTAWENEACDFVHDHCVKRHVKFRVVSVAEYLSDLPAKPLVEERILLLRMILAKEAKLLQVRRVFYGGDATSLAGLTLYYLACGGAHLYWRITSEHDVVGDLLILRPLRNLLSSEAALAAHFFQVPYVQTSAVSRTDPRNVKRVIRNFLCGISVNFKSTIFNILRTVDKIPHNETLDRPLLHPAKSESRSCAVCLSEIRTENVDKLALGEVCKSCQLVLTM